MSNTSKGLAEKRKQILDADDYQFRIEIKIK